jgi:hypothetical protein
MKRFIAPLIAIALLGLSTVAVAQGSAGNVRRCGDIGLTGPQNIRTRNVSCTAARHLARAHHGTCDLRRRRCFVGDYTCTRKFFGDSGTRVHCANGRRVVGFFYGT